MLNDEVFSKYNHQTPRYTSYPGITFWRGIFSNETAALAIREKVSSSQNFKAALYIHLPFCESMCSFCGCTKIISTNHDVEDKYCETLLREWQLYKENAGKEIEICEVHLGGGTPTFFSPKHLENVLSTIFSQSKVSPQCEMSFEAHPNNTTIEHLDALRSLGFKRMSLGIQDFDPKILDIVHREQNLDGIFSIYQAARNLGIESINFDLIYGLPYQTRSSIRKNIDIILRWRPDRIAFYAYAHVPWIKPGQKRFENLELPAGKEKLGLFMSGYEKLIEGGYVDIGMDHFAIPEDSLALALKKKTLHRNFMGYTSTTVPHVIGLGMSSISDYENFYVQNSKSLADYYEKVWAGKLPFVHGHTLTPEEQQIRKKITHLMCYRNLELTQNDYQNLLSNKQITELCNDKIVTLSETELKVTEEGMPFLRNVCAAIDPCYSQPVKPSMSPSV